MLLSSQMVLHLATLADAACVICEAAVVRRTDLIVQLVERPIVRRTGLIVHAVG